MDKSGICDGQDPKLELNTPAPKPISTSTPTSVSASPIKHPIVRVHRVHKLER